MDISETLEQHLWCLRSHGMLTLLFDSQKVLMIKMCFMHLLPCRSIWPEKIAQPLNGFHKKIVHHVQTGAPTEEKSTRYSQGRKPAVMESTCCLLSHPSFMTWKYQQRHASIREAIAHCVAEKHVLDLESEALLKLVNEPSVSSAKTLLSKKQKLQIKSITGKARKAQVQPINSEQGG